MRNSEQIFFAHGHPRSILVISSRKLYSQENFIHETHHTIVIPMSRLHLYFPYYTPQNAERHEEINFCLQKNQSVGEIEKIYLLIDDGSDPPTPINDNVEIIELESRPTYACWLQLSEKLSQGCISILANSDIYLDSSISLLSDVLNAGRLYSLVCLSRYEIIEGKPSLHKNPKWSQDLWALKVHGVLNRNLLHSCKFNMGVPRCDNKIAAVFSEHGYQIYNPCKFIYSYHIHKSDAREYNSMTDIRILGSTVWVEPSERLDKPSKLHLDYWTLNDKQIFSHKINNTLGELHGTDSLSASLAEQSLIIAHDDDWQYPAITEKHAYECMIHTFGHDKNLKNIKYLAFPWATLIDHLKNKPNEKVLERLTRSLKRLKPQLHEASKIITVCQHIRMLEFEAIFSEMNVTDVFWSHSTRELKHFPRNSDISIHPFPLYAVQCPTEQLRENDQSDFLFSFVGAKSAPFYLTKSRNMIIDNFSGLQNAYVRGRDSWHYNQIVYDHQIKDSADSLKDLVDTGKSLEFIDIMKRSIFSLCPSGSGPNSIRLWESIGLGAIPVVMSDTLALPGAQSLWEQACVFCKETESDIKQLPDLLGELANNPKLIAGKRHLLKQIWAVYGTGSFVSDIKELIISFVNDECILFKEPSDDLFIYPSKPDTTDSEENLVPSKVSRLNFPPMNLSSLNSYALLYPDEARTFIKENSSFAEEIFSSANDAAKTIFAKINYLKKLEAPF